MLRLLDVDVQSEQLRLAVDRRQGGRSLSDIREVLLDFGISTKSYNLSANALVELEAPVVVQILKEDREELVILKQWDLDYKY